MKHLTIHVFIVQPLPVLGVGLPIMSSGVALPIQHLQSQRPSILPPPTTPTQPSIPSALSRSGTAPGIQESKESDPRFADCKVL